MEEEARWEVCQQMLWLLSVALNTSAAQQAEGTPARQHWKSRKSGNSTPHLTWSSLLPNMQILMLPFSFSNLNLLRNVRSTPGSLQAPSGSLAWISEKRQDPRDFHSAAKKTLKLAAEKKAKQGIIQSFQSLKALAWRSTSHGGINHS